MTGPWGLDPVGKHAALGVAASIVCVGLETWNRVPKPGRLGAATGLGAQRSDDAAELVGMAAKPITRIWGSRAFEWDM